MPAKAKGKRYRDAVKPLSGLDVDSLLGKEKRAKISNDNAIPEFKQMLETTEDPNGIEEAAKQLSAIIREQITESFGDSGYGRAIEELRVMKEELTSLEEPLLYNNFIRDLKKGLLAGELGGERREMWWEIRKNRLGMIDSKKSEVSEVTEEEAEEVRCCC